LAGSEGDVRGPDPAKADGVLDLRLLLDAVAALGAHETRAAESENSEDGRGDSDLWAHRQLQEKLDRRSVVIVPDCVTGEHTSAYVGARLLPSTGLKPSDLRNCG
jgi:hypothetical protein